MFGGLFSFLFKRCSEFFPFVCIIDIILCHLQELQTETSNVALCRIGTRRPLWGRNAPKLNKAMMTMVAVEKERRERKVARKEARRERRRNEMCERQKLYISIENCLLLRFLMKWRFLKILSAFFFICTAIMAADCDWMIVKNRLITFIRQVIGFRGPLSQLWLLLASLNQPRL